MAVRIALVSACAAALVSACGPVAPTAQGSSRPPSASPSLASTASAASPAASPSLSPSLSPSATASAAETLSPTAEPIPAPGTALAALATLAVKGRAPKTGYTRDQFGPAWSDVNGNGCSTRNDVLAAVLRDVRRIGCRVLSGWLDDPYTGTTIKQGYGAIDIDHMVALSDAWQKGAQQWTEDKRLRFANDPLNLQPTLPSVNSEKSDSDAASWLPSNKPYRCEYVARLIAVKKKYGLWVTPAEKAAMERVLRTCPGQKLSA